MVLILSLKKIYADVADSPCGIQKNKKPDRHTFYYFKCQQDTVELLPTITKDQQ